MSTPASSRIPPDWSSAHWSSVVRLPQGGGIVCGYPSRLNALTSRVLESLGVRHLVVGALSALETNGKKEKVAEYSFELSSVFLA